MKARKINLRGAVTFAIHYPFIYNGNIKNHFMTEPYIVVAFSNESVGVVVESVNVPAYPVGFKNTWTSFKRNDIWKVIFNYKLKKETLHETLQ